MFYFQEREMRAEVFEGFFGVGVEMREMERKR